MQSSSQTVTTNKPTSSFFYRPDALPVAQSTVSKQRENYYYIIGCCYIIRNYYTIGWSTCWGPISSRQPIRWPSSHTVNVQLVISEISTITRVRKKVKGSPIINMRIGFRGADPGRGQSVHTFCTKFDSGLLCLHEADEAAVDWLTSYGS